MNVDVGIVFLAVIGITVAVVAVGSGDARIVVTLVRGIVVGYQEVIPDRKNVVKTHFEGFIAQKVDHITGCLVYVIMRRSS